MPIEYEKDGAVATISIRGADEKNAFTPDMTIELHRVLREFEGDPNIHVGILRGAGGGHFSAGTDPESEALLLEEASSTKGILRQYMYPLAQQRRSPWVAWQTVLRWRTSKPVIAAVNGDCLDLALILVSLHSDIRVAGAGARFGLPEVRRGAGSGDALVSRLAKQIPITAVNWMVETGQFLDARAAHDSFLVNEVVTEEAVDARAREVADMVAGLPAHALRAEKLALIHTERLDYEDGAVLVSALATLAQISDNGKGGG